MGAEQQTHFGYQVIDQRLKTEKVSHVFKKVSPYYDRMNDLMSLGLHRLWKKIAIARTQIEHHHTVLDLACGTGDLTQLIAQTLTTGTLVMSDINASMLHSGMNRLLDHGILQALPMQANAEQLPFPNNTFDRITMAFGLRNVTAPQLALQEMYRLLKPNGRVMILEFSKPQKTWLNDLFWLYSFKMIPKIGELFYEDSNSYQYLVESIQKHPPQEKLKAFILEAGFNHCEYQNLSGGIVAIHIGYKYR